MPLVRPPRWRGALALALLVAGLGGCALTFDARSLGVPAAMSAAATAPVAGDTFQVTRTAVHLFWGVYELRRADLQAALANQLGEGRGIANLRIRTSHRLTDVLAAVLTAGVVVPTSVTFEGTITRPSR